MAPQSTADSWVSYETSSTVNKSYIIHVEELNDIKWNVIGLNEVRRMDEAFIL